MSEPPEFPYNATSDATQMVAPYTPDADYITGPDLETPMRLVRELDAETKAGNFDFSDRQHRGQYREALTALVEVVDRRMRALGWIGSRLEAEKIAAADRAWQENAERNPAPNCPGCGGRTTRIRRLGADHDVFTCVFCDTPETEEGLTDFPDPPDTCPGCSRPLPGPGVDCCPDCGEALGLGAKVADAVGEHKEEIGGRP